MRRLLTTIACLAAVACGPAPGHPLLGEWRIVEVDAKTPLADSWPGVAFRRAPGAGRIAYEATTGCNTLSGSLNVSGRDLRPERNGTSTTIGCRGPVTRQEDAIEATLGQAKTWTVRPDGALLVAGADGGSLLMVRGRAPSSRAWLPETSVEAPGLLGDWRAVTPEGAPLTRPPISITITPIRIHFGMECVARSWDYTAAEGRISTRELSYESCDLGLGPVAESVWDVLRGARTYSLVETGEAIITAGDGRRIHLRRAPSS